MNTDPRVPNLYVRTSDAVRLSVCAWPGMEDSTDVIPLGLKTERAGWITFSTAEIARIPAGQPIYFCDAKTGNATKNLQNEPEYRLHLAAGTYENRFFLAFRSAATTLPVNPPEANNTAYHAYSEWADCMPAAPRHAMWLFSIWRAS